MNTESENKLLARRLLEEVLNQREFDRLAEFLAPDYVADYGTIVGLQGARDHILVFLHWRRSWRWVWCSGPAKPVPTAGFPANRSFNEQVH